MNRVTELSNDYKISFSELGGDFHGRIVLAVHSKFNTIDDAIAEAQRIQGLLNIPTHILITQLSF